MTDLFANDILDYSSLKQVHLTENIERFSLKEGDLLFARRSLNVEGAGKCVLVPRISYPVVFESSIIRITVDVGMVTPEFVHHVLNSLFGRRIMTRIVQVVAVSGITGNDLRKIKIPFPPLEEQQKISSVLSTIDLYIQKQIDYSMKSRILKKGLMQKLLTGKIRVRVQ